MEAGAEFMYGDGHCMGKVVRLHYLETVIKTRVSDSMRDHNGKMPMIVDNRALVPYDGGYFRVTAGRNRWMVEVVFPSFGKEHYFYRPQEIKKLPMRDYNRPGNLHPEAVPARTLGAGSKKEGPPFSRAQSGGF